MPPMAPSPALTSPVPLLPLPDLLSFCSFSVCRAGESQAGAGAGSLPDSPTPWRTQGSRQGGTYEVLEVADQPVLGTVPCQEGFAA